MANFKELKDGSTANYPKTETETETLVAKADCQKYS